MGFDHKSFGWEVGRLLLLLILLRPWACVLYSSHVVWVRLCCVWIVSLLLLEQTTDSWTRSTRMAGCIFVGVAGLSERLDQKPLFSLFLVPILFCSSCRAITIWPLSGARAHRTRIAAAGPLFLLCARA
jgi:hypothetical protein